jgi:wyosine [tRNA(Phe)-imidazoG37] synthetase (radical SAM superfamily)
MLVYGPVPSRRLGRCLGLNNIPYKYCSYSCIYCRVGGTTKMQTEPAVYYQPEALLRETKARIEKLGADSSGIDYVCFVTDGEPTLDRNLGVLISMLKQDLSYPVAVFTGASLLWREEVAEAVSLADWVSVKVDTVVESTWRRINRPDRRLEFLRVLEGIRTFASNYTGKLVSETTLLGGENTDEVELSGVAGYLKEISPSVAYLCIPDRSPAASGLILPNEEQLKRAAHAFEDAGLEACELWAH